MDAMILAAGRGTRLQPLTDRVPKALVEVGGITMLERVARRLIEAGTTRLIVNTHHLGDQVARFLEERNFFGVEGFISAEEEEILDTGGGLYAAREFFHGDAPFFLHNVDILCDTDLRAMYDTACASEALATLAVMNREASRYLLFDEKGLCGHGNVKAGLEREAREPSGEIGRLGFCGIHVLAPDIFDRIEERGVFSIITTYMRLASEEARILPWYIEGDNWLDIGTPEKLEEANRKVEGGL